MIADKVAAKNLKIGSLVAPVWFDGTAMGDEASREGWLNAVRKSIKIASRLRELGIREHGVVRIDSAAPVGDWAKDPKANTTRIAQTFREAGKIAEDAGERLAAEGEICWGGMHSWQHMLDLLEETGMPGVVGFQADMSHTLLYTLGENAPEHRIVPAKFDWEPGAFRAAMKQLTDAKGKLNIARDSGYWLRDSNGAVTQSMPHICWDGCMFPNSVMNQQQTWNDILTAMIEVRKNHGWKA